MTASILRIAFPVNAVDYESEGPPTIGNPHSLSGWAGYSAFLRLEFLNYLTRVGEPASYTFGKHELIIYDDIKDTAPSRDQLRLNTIGVAQFIRQTGGFGLIVSLLAIMYINFHDVPPADSSLSKYSFIRGG
jgi:hypothetical protein